MRGGLLRGKPPLLFLRSGILAGQGSFLYAESRNKQNWMDHLYPPADYRLIIRKLDELQETMDALVEVNPIKRDAMKLYITLQNVASTADVLRRAVMPFVSRREKK